MNLSEVNPEAGELPAKRGASQNSGEGPDVDLYIQLLGQHQRRIMSYVVSLVPNWGDAEDILQETHMVLWREFGKFEPGTNFAAWACKIAFHQVLAFRKKRQRDRLQFSDEFLEAVAKEFQESTDRLEQRHQLLARCVEKLQKPHREILTLRYSEGFSNEKVAERVGRTAGACYRVLSRIRRTLHECVSRSLAKESMG